VGRAVHVEAKRLRRVRRRAAPPADNRVDDIEGGLGDDLGTTPAGSTTPIDTLDAGTIEYLPPGKSIEFTKPPGVEGFRDYSTITLWAIARGYGVTYEALTGDYSGVNFSSGRMGWLGMWEEIEQFRRLEFIPQVCSRVWSWFLESAELAGRLEGRRSATWTPPRRLMVDPGKETKAIKDRIRSGLTTLPEEIRGQGFDPEEVVRETAAFQARLDEAGIILDSDPRQDKAGTGSPGGSRGPSTDELVDRLEDLGRDPRTRDEVIDGTIELLEALVLEREEQGPPLNGRDRPAD